MKNIYEKIVELKRITTEHNQFSNTANNILYNDLGNNISEFNTFCTGSIEQLYSNIVKVLSLCSSEAVPKVVSRGAKFWWDSTLQNIKVQSIVTHKAWIQPGRPTSGQLYLDKLSAKSAFKTKLIKQIYIKLFARFTFR